MSKVIIKYINTDLDLIGEHDISALAAALCVGRMHALYLQQVAEKHWEGHFETTDQFTEPEDNINDMVTVIEGLGPALRNDWDRCSKREFNIGYGCGTEPRSFEQRLGNQLLHRIARAGATIGITIYPGEIVAVE